MRLGVPVFASSDVLDRAATVPDDETTRTSEEGEEAGATATRRRKASTRRRPARSLDQTRLAIFREFVNSLDPDRRPARGPVDELGRPSCPVATPRIGRPRRPARSRFAHMRRRRLQKSFTARQMTDGLAPVGEPAVRG